MSTMNGYIQDKMSEQWRKADVFLSGIALERLNQIYPNTKTLMTHQWSYATLKMQWSTKLFLYNIFKFPQFFFIYLFI